VLALAQRAFCAAAIHRSRFALRVVGVAAVLSRPYIRLASRGGPIVLRPKLKVLHRNVAGGVNFFLTRERVEGVLMNVYGPIRIGSYDSCFVVVRGQMAVCAAYAAFDLREPGGTLVEGD